MFALRDPDVEEVLTWFEQCYDLNVHPTTGRAYWHRAVLPSEGGIGEQDARLINGMAYVAEVQQAVLDENAKRKARERETEQ